jgi:glycosyltransferase involved in cell wall biosynthesis/peptidoglycan/xylan/chitin deacetylase (PgdA/CDA1 family)
MIQLITSSNDHQTKLDDVDRKAPISGRFRMALLLDHPSPHMVGILDALACIDEIAAQVIYFRPGAPQRSWGDPPGNLPYQIAGSSRHSSVFTTVQAVVRMVTKIRADIVVVNSCYTAPETWAAILALNAKGIPWVYMNEPVRMQEGIRGVKNRLLKMMLGNAAGLIGMGQTAQAQFVEIVNGKLPSTSVPYYLNLDQFMSLPMPQSPSSQEPIRFLIVAQLIHRKAFDVLLEACTKLRSDAWTLSIVGDGPLRQKLEREFGKRWTSERVRFFGQIPFDARVSIFASHHVFVFPSRWDGWGMAPVEAMAAGLPVISSSQVMSMREFIRDGENGYLIESENADSLADRMRCFLSDRDKISTFGRAARLALASYNESIGARHLSDFLTGLLQDRNVLRNQELQSIPQTPYHPPTWRDLTEPTRVSKRVRKSCRAWAKHAVINFSLALRPRFSPMSHRILVYHLVLPEDRTRFEEQLVFLKDHYRFVTARELALSRGMEHNIPMLAITFDDGFKVLMSDALELLEKHSIKATFYVPTGFIAVASDPERAVEFSRRVYYYRQPLAPMTPEDLRALRKHMHEIGSHGVSHIGLNRISEHGAARELNDSRRQLAEWLGEPVYGFAYPYGDVHSSLGVTSNWVASARYEYAVTLNRGAVSSDSDAMLLQRDHAEGNWRASDLAYFLRR